MMANAKSTLSAQFRKGGMMLKASRKGTASINVVTTLGQVEKSLNVELGAGFNWIPMDGVSAGKYIVRVKQGSSTSNFTWEKK